MYMSTEAIGALAALQSCSEFPRWPEALGLPVPAIYTMIGNRQTCRTQRPLIAAKLASNTFESKHADKVTVTALCRERYIYIYIYIALDMCTTHMMYRHIEIYVYEMKRNRGSRVGRSDL